MSRNDSEDERTDGGVEAVDFDDLADDDLPEWATEEASVPSADPVPDSSEAPPDASGAADVDDAVDADAAADAADDEPADAATAVNFANVETGASASVSLGDDAVGWSRSAADIGDTAGTSVDPDLDDVDPSTLLDAADDDEFPRPGADAGPDPTPTTERAASTDSAAMDVSTEPGSQAPLGASVFPDDPAVAFGLGAVLLLIVGGLSLLLASVLAPATAAGIVIVSGLVVGALALAGDLLDDPV
jgi:hypothetical protein